MEVIKEIVRFNEYDEPFIISKLFKSKSDLKRLG